MTGLAFAAAPAHACSCTADTTFRKQLEGADQVVVATVERESRAEQQTAGQVDVKLDVVANRVYKGTVTEARMSVVAAGGDCGYWNGSDDQKLLLVIKDGRADMCGGSRVATTSTVERVQSRLGSGTRLATPPPAEAVLTPQETRGPRDFARLAAPGAAAALLGLLGLGVVSRVQKL